MPKSDMSARLVASPIWKYGLAVLCVAAAIAIAKLLQGFMDALLLALTLFDSHSTAPALDPTLKLSQ